MSGTSASNLDVVDNRCGRRSIGSSGSVACFGCSRLIEDRRLRRIGLFRESRCRRDVPFHDAPDEFHGRQRLTIRQRMKKMAMWILPPVATHLRFRCRRCEIARRRTNVRRYAIFECTGAGFVRASKSHIVDAQGPRSHGALSAPQYAPRGPKEEMSMTLERRRLPTRTACRLRPRARRAADQFALQVERPYCASQFVTCTRPSAFLQPASDSRLPIYAALITEAQTLTAMPNEQRRRRAHPLPDGRAGRWPTEA